MRYGKFLILAIAIALLAVPSSAKEKKIIESKWTAAAIQVDGASADWDQNALEFDKDVKVNFGFKNDAERLYVLFVFNDPRYTSTIESTGLTMWINAEGKEKRNYGLHFHREMVSGDRLIQQMESQGQTLTEEEKLEIKSKPGYMLFLCDALNKKGDVVPLPGSSRGTYRVMRAQGKTIYELGFPLALLDDPGAKTKWDPAQPLKIGFEWGGLTAAQKKARAERASEMAGEGGGGGGGGEGEEGGGGGGGRGGGRGGGGGVSMGGSERSSMKYDFWIDLKIAQNG